MTTGTKQKILDWYKTHHGLYRLSELTEMLDEYSAEVRDMVEQEEAEAREMDDLHNCN